MSMKSYKGMYVQDMAAIRDDSSSFAFQLASQVAHDKENIRLNR